MVILLYIKVQLILPPSSRPNKIGFNSESVLIVMSSEIKLFRTKKVVFIVNWWYNGVVLIERLYCWINFIGCLNVVERWFVVPQGRIEELYCKINFIGCLFPPERRVVVPQRREPWRSVHTGDQVCRSRHSWRCSYRGLQRLLVISRTGRVRWHGNLQQDRTSQCEIWSR